MDLHKTKLRICDKSDVYSGENPQGIEDLHYEHTNVVLRGADDAYFYAEFKGERLEVDEIDIKKLNIIRIPEDHIWPLADPKFTRAPEPLPATSYWKRPCLLDYDVKEPDFYPIVMLKEAEVCEILRKHPHPNIARYLGCIIKDGWIKGLAFDKYPVTLGAMLEEETPFDKDRCIRGIEAGVQHMHGLGLVHNDLNPKNIMMDGGDPIIIDFDSCMPEGEKLLNGGTMDWADHKEHFSKRSNDFYSLSKIREALFGRGEKGEDGQNGEERREVEEDKKAEGGNEIEEEQNGGGSKESSDDEESKVGEEVEEGQESEGDEKSS
ncbi:hypothetical protein F4801DRAFT_605430 [Xylaria longipes]|nr:hypothetical protein F4801DRAFT_605430 [Xylaria longipes]